MNKDTTPIHSRYLPWLLALTVLFVLRVLAQAVQWAGPVDFLPPFDAWQGSALPYPLLLTTQVAVIAVLLRVLFLVRADVIRPATWKHNACFILGGAYFTVMAFRLAAGLTFLADIAWFAHTLPALFHVVLATFVLLLGHYLYRLGKRAR